MTRKEVERTYPPTLTFSTLEPGTVLEGRYDGCKPIKTRAGRDAMVYKFTDAGAKNIKGTVQRARESRTENEQRGFTVRGLYWTQGQYDMVAVVEAPDEQAMLAGLFNIASAGNVRSETLRAFTETEMEAVRSEFGDEI